jgi:rare lipoprotein A
MSHRNSLSALALALAIFAAVGASHAQTQAPAAADQAAAASTSQGKLAYYGAKFAGRKTASGERFNPEAMTMAHKTLPFGTKVRVTREGGKRSVVVRVNDRGPTTPDRVGDLSYAAARKLGMLRVGVAMATLEVVGQPPARKGKKA